MESSAFHELEVLLLVRRRVVSGAFQGNSLSVPNGSLLPQYLRISTLGPSKNQQLTGFARPNACLSQAWFLKRASAGPPTETHLNSRNFPGRFSVPSSADGSHNLARLERRIEQRRSNVWAAN